MSTLICNSVECALTKTDLYFANNFNKWVPLPLWGTFFLNLGRYVAESHTGENRLVVGLAVPTRNYASALAALGIVITREKFHTNRFDIDRHFPDICRLKTGTSVSFKYQGKELPAIYEGINDIDGQPRLRIRVQSTETGGLTHLVSKKESSKISIAAKPVLSLPKKAKGQSIIVYNNFFNVLIDKVKAADLFAYPRLDCTIIGSISTIKHEITDIRFACKSTENTFQEGILQDVLRSRNFITENQAYRSEILSIKGNKTPQTANGLLPHVTIFDGASAFIKWRDNWRNSHWIILLDRTERHFHEATEIINYEYSSRVEVDETLNLPTIPPPVEIVLYQEARQ